MPYAIVVLLILISDQAVKLWTSKSIPVNGAPRDFIPGFIQLTNVHNSGAAFGILQDAGARWFFIVLAAAFVALVVWLLKNDVIKGRLGRWTLVMVMAGGVGNCLDRIVSGYVVDMFCFKPSFLNWFPVFNVADIFISVCGVLFCIYLLKNRDDLNDEPVKQSVQRMPARSSRDENEQMPERGIDYIAQLSHPVVEGRKNIEAEKLTREIETQEPKLTVGPGDWVNPFGEEKPAPVEAPPKEHVNPFQQMNATAAESATVKADVWVNPFGEKPEAPAAPDEGTETPVENAGPAEVSEPAPAPESTSAAENAEDLPADATSAEPKDDSDFSVDDIIAEFKDK